MCPDHQSKKINICITTKSSVSHWGGVSQYSWATSIRGRTSPCWDAVWKLSMAYHGLSHSLMAILRKSHRVTWSLSTSKNSSFQSIPFMIDWVHVRGTARPLHSGDPSTLKERVYENRTTNTRVIINKDEIVTKILTTRSHYWLQNLVPVGLSYCRAVKLPSTTTTGVRWPPSPPCSTRGTQCWRRSILPGCLQTHCLRSSGYKKIRVLSLNNIRHQSWGVHSA